MGLDVRTLVVVLGITHLIQVAVFFQQYKINKTYQGVGWWLLWSAAEVVGFVFMLLWDIPAIHLMAIIVQQSMIFLGTIFIYIGVMRFLGRKVNRAVIVSVYVVFIAALVYFVYVDNHMVIRSVIVCGSLATISFFTVWTLLVHKMPSIAASANFNAAIFLVHGGLFTHRTVMILAGTPVDDVFTPTLFNYLPYLDGLIVGLLWTFGFIIMLNQRLNAEKVEAKGHFEHIFQTSPDASLITRLTDGLVADINDGFTALTGFTRAETIGKSTLDVNIWKNPEDRQKVVHDLGEKGFCQNREAVFVRKDGSQAIGILSAKIISLSNIPHIISVTRDITELKQAERSQAEHAAKLEEINKELESFSYSVSHDLRAPLRAIAGFSRMILKKEGERFDEETRRRFQVITDNVETMGRIIDDLLAFSRLGRQEVTKVDLDMEALIRDAWQELVMIHPDRKMSLSIGQMPTAPGDRTLIRQVYGNLLGNAVKFTQGRNPAVIEAGCLVGDEGTVYYVRDNGIGFDMKFHDKLFGVFQRLHSNEEYEGTGIGLAIVQRIINRHGGRVWAEAKGDEGATFYFFLPSAHPAR